MSADTKVPETRAILPLCPIRQFCDAVLAKRLQTYIDALLPDVPGIYRGCRPNTQTSDIPTAVQILIEKSQEYGIPEAFAQIDVQQHYDNVSILKVGEWLHMRGVPADLVRVAISFQLLPK